MVLWHRNDRGRSPDRGSSWSDRYKSVNRERSRSRSPDRAAPPQYSQVSFHKAMMERSGGESDRSKSFNQVRSRSPSPYRQERAPAGRERSPVNSFHRSMLGQGQPSFSSQRQHVPHSDESYKEEKSSRYARSPPRRSPSSPGGGRANNSPQKEWGVSSGDGKYGGSHTYNGEEEEGMIPDEEGMIGQDDSIYQSVD